MWTTQTESLEAGKVHRISFRSGEAPLTFREVFQNWQADRDFRSHFISALTGAPPHDFFWEMPPITPRTIDRPFECVLVDGPVLATLRPDSSPFDEHFWRDHDPSTVLTFPNLGGDATLIVPRPIGDPAAYPHLAAFLREAPESQVDELWSEAAIAVQAHLSDEPLWLSTAGLGVSWLHLRLDSRPKYYRYSPYKREE